ncbi:hypothetical protein [Mucilaginibacter sp.]|jgi:hypothetical protein|uniref:hypothetical protein n=1 Tax=Mucilaginibacter sp. TaxID=1882438 RepID=UPI003565AF02
MEVFQSIKVLLPNSKAGDFKSEVIKKAATIGWANKVEFERDYSKNTMNDDVVLCIETPELHLGSKVLKAYLWMRSDDNLFEIFNIIPIKTRVLSYAEYNFILGEFYRLVIKEVTRQMGIDAVITSPEKLMQDIVGDDIYTLLYRFSKSANKSTGNTNPHDFARWSDFVIAIFRNKIELSADELVRWLEEDENWDNDMAWKLGLDFEYALQILDKYEQSQ